MRSRSRRDGLHGLENGLRLRRFLATRQRRKVDNVSAGCPLLEVSVHPRARPFQTLRHGHRWTHLEEIRQADVLVVPASDAVDT